MGAQRWNPRWPPVMSSQMQGKQIHIPMRSSRCHRLPLLRTRTALGQYCDLRYTV